MAALARDFKNERIRLRLSETLFKFISAQAKIPSCFSIQKSVSKS
jgi:hypothetical protein